MTRGSFVLLAAALASCGPRESLDDRLEEIRAGSIALARAPAPDAPSDAELEDLVPSARIVVSPGWIRGDDAWPALAAWDAEPRRLRELAAHDGAGAVLPQGPFEIAALEGGRGGADLDGALAHGIDRLVVSTDRYASTGDPGAAARASELRRVLLQIDPSVPFETVERLACALGASIARGQIVVRQSGRARALPVGFAAERRAPRAIDGALELSIWLRYDGISIAGSGGTARAGCRELGEPDAIAVPRRGDGWDLDALRACLRAIERDFPDETEIAIHAERRVPFGRALDAMLAARGGDLFPDLVLCRE